MSPTVSNQRVFMDISIDGSIAGRLEIELFCEIAPQTSENFRALCTGVRKDGTNLCYKGSPFHRIVNKFMIQGGDITSGDGRGGQSIYGRYFDDEAFIVKHAEPYMISMANKGPNTNSSQFFITTSVAEHCDGKHVVFGKIVRGHDIVDAMEKVKTDSTGKPKKDVIIVHCGQLFKKAKLKKNEDMNVINGGDINENTDNSIPECPKSWLYRDDSDDKKREETKYKRRRSYSREKRRDRSIIRSEKFIRNRRSSSRSQDKSHDSATNRVRGRGTIRFRKDRSNTPDHWKYNAPKKYEHVTVEKKQTDQFE